MIDTIDLRSVSTVGDLRLWDARMDIGQPARAAEAAFSANAQLPAIVVLRDGEPCGLLSRAALKDTLSQPLGRDIYIRRPVSAMLEIMDQNPLLLDHGVPIAAAVERALSRPPAMAYEPILVATPGAPHRVLAVDLLLRVQSALLDMTITAKDRLVEEVQRTAGELRHALYELKEAHNRLVQSEKMAALGQLVAGVAHEINTPIGVALTAATHLGERTQEFASTFAGGQMKRSDLQGYVQLAGQSVDLVRFNIQRAAQLIQSFKQVAVDQTSEQRRNFDLCEYLEQLVTSLRPEARKLGHVISFECPDGIGMNSYPGALAQALSNLVSNAMTHAYPEGTGGPIRVNARELGDGIEIAVSDDGGGIPPEHLGRIYDPFFTTRRGAGGSGIGLHIVFNIVREILHGDIECSSTPGIGTTFTITMPRVSPE